MVPIIFERCLIVLDVVLVLDSDETDMHIIWILWAPRAVGKVRILIKTKRAI
jgi:hypothetical protein